jgi:hypothetical protein
MYRIKAPDGQPLRNILGDELAFQTLRGAELCAQHEDELRKQLEEYQIYDEASGMTLSIPSANSGAA